MFCQVIVGVCAMEKKTHSKPMTEILNRLQEFVYIKTVIFKESVILNFPGKRIGIECRYFPLMIYIFQI